MVPVGSPRRGEIWLVETPGQPRDPHQPRPTIVVSSDIRNRLADDVIVVPIFSRGRLGPSRLAIPAGMGGLRHDSVVFCDEICTIDESFLAHGPLGGTLPRWFMDAVVRGVRRAIGEYVAEISETHRSGS